MSRYWVGGSGDWGSTSHWSTTSGGASGASVPTSSDDVFFDANSSGGSFTVTASVGQANARNVSLAATSMLTIDMSFQLNIYGTFTYNANVLFSYSQLFLRAAVTYNFGLLYPTQVTTLLINVQSSAVVNLTADMNFRELALGSGAGLVTNNYDLAIGPGGFGLYALSTTGTIDLGTSTLTIIGGSTGFGFVVGSGATVSAASSTIEVSAELTSSYVNFVGGGKSYGTLHVVESGLARKTRISDSNTFGTLTLDPGSWAAFTAGTTQTISNLSAPGVSGSPIKLESSTSGVKWFMNKSSGTASGSYLNIQDSTVAGGATWNANSSNDNGNNTGWNFVGPAVPIANFTGTPTSGTVAFSVTFTDTSSGVPTSWLWNFGDGATSTSQNPSHTYTSSGAYTVALTATNSLGSNTKTSLSYISAAANTVSPTGDTSAEADGTGLTVTPGQVVITPTADASEEADGTLTVVYNIWDIGGDASEEADGGSIVVTVGDPPPPEEVDWSNLGTENTKDFIYKVSNSSGTFIGVWKDVKDELAFSQPLNSPGTTTTVFLSRSANQTIEVREPMADSTGDPYTDSTGDPYYVIGETNNTVGEDTDVQVGYLVDIIAVYGGYEELVDEDEEPYVDQDGDAYIVATGAPMGRRVFSGKILKYKATYGERVGVEVTLASHGVELSDEFVRSGTTTTVTYTTTAIETTLKSILDTNPGEMSYDNGSIDATGVSPTIKFQLNTKLEAIKSLFTQTPAGWYWYGNVADNLIYLKPIGTTADHVFLKGKHISKIDPEQSMENLINVVHVVGGDTGGGVKLYKEYTDSASITQWGRHVHRITDRRITLTATAQRYAEKILSMYSQPIYTTTVEVSSSAYDIETVQLGQIVGMGNFDNFIDGQLLQIVNINYTPRKLTLQLGGLLDSQAQIITDVQEDLANEQYEGIPTVPS